MGKDSKGLPRAKRQKIEESEQMKCEDSSDFSDEISVQSKATGFLTNDASTNDLTAAIAEAQSFMQYVLKSLSHLLEADFHKRLQDMISLATNTVVRLAFSGPSGAGKSSLINALLELDDVLPTGSWGEACTPIIIEVSYNDDPNFAFRAKLQYIPEDSWRDDIESARLAAANGISPTKNGADPLSRVIAVYPNFMNELQQLSVDEILRSSTDIKDLLGKSAKIKGNDQKAFAAQLRSKLIPEFYNTRGKPQTWSLVESVHVYVASPILEDGLVLVDVPGIGDSNKNRGGRATEYISTCSAICLVGDGLRIGSDAAFRNHLDDALHHVQYGNRLGRVMLICTKADAAPANVTKDINDEEFQELHREKAAAQDAYDVANGEVEVYEGVANDENARNLNCISELRIWRSRRTKILNGREVFMPSPKSGGRTVKGEQITYEVANAKVLDFESQKNDAIARMNAARTKVDRELQPDLITKHSDLIAVTMRLKKFQLQHIITRSKEKLATICNEAITDYIAEIIEESADTTDAHIPTKPTTDPPFFCVSAQKYHKLRGLTHDDVAHEAFTDESDTGIPALSAHISRVVTTARHDMLLSIYKQMETTLLSLDLILWGGIESRAINPDEAATAIAEATGTLGGVKTRFAAQIAQATSAIDTLYETRFVQRIGEIAKGATGRLVEAMEYWPEDRSAAGLALKAAGARRLSQLSAMEYRAVVAKRGEHRGVRLIQYNFNKRVERKVRNRLVPVWEELFVGGTVVWELSGVVRRLCGCVDELHAYVRERAVRAGVDAYALGKIDRLVGMRKGRVREAVRAAKREIREVHAAAGALVASDVKRAWGRGYSKAEREGRGIGALQLMNSIMRESVVKDKIVMKVLGKLEERMNAALAEVLERMAGQLKDVAGEMVGDYEKALMKRDQNAVVAMDPKVDEVRSRMIVLGYASAKTGGCTRESSSSPEEELSEIMEWGSDE